MENASPAHGLFIGLVQDVCSELRREAPELKIEPGVPMVLNLTVREVDFVIIFNPLQSLDRIYIYCCFGSIPERIEREVLYRLLEVNLALPLVQAAALGIDPESHEVVYHFNGLLGDISATTLLESLSMAARQAEKWRSSYFLKDSEMPMERGAFGTPLIA